MGDEIRHVLVADLPVDVGRRDAPGRAHRVPELFEREVSARQIGAESTFALVVTSVNEVTWATLQRNRAAGSLHERWLNSRVRGADLQVLRH